MDFITTLYFIFTFIGFYHLSLFTLIYIQNKKRMFENPKPKKDYSLSIVIPCFNAEDTIGRTIQAQLDSDYLGLKKIIVVDDCSTDNSAKIIKEYEKKYEKVLYVKTPKNTGNAAGAKNYGAKFVKTELIGFSDDDSLPNKDAISKMMGFFNDEKVGAVTSRVLVRNKKNFLARIQSVEYKLIAFTRKLFGFVESIYVTNGPMSIYRKVGFDQVKGFNPNNLTEDIEITWNFVKHGWKVRISLLAVAYTDVPLTLKAWFKQRIRWNVGGLQTVWAYRKTILRCGMLGFFIWPYFTLAWILGISGLGLLVYRVSRYIFLNYLAASYSLEAQTALLRFNDISFSPSVLAFFGFVLLTLSLLYNVLALLHSREKSKEFKNENAFSFLAYMFVYLLLYPIVLIISGIKFLRGYNEWGGTRFENVKK